MAAHDGDGNPRNGGDDWSRRSSPADPRSVGGLADRFSALDFAADDPSSRTSLSQVLNTGEAPESVVEEQTDASKILKASINGNLDLHLESVRAHSSISLGMAEGTTSQVHADNHVYFDNSNTSGETYINFGAKLGVSGAGLSQVSSPSSRSFSPIRYLKYQRYQKETQYDKLGLLGHGMMPMSELNSISNHWKQNLIIRVRDDEEEIVQLRKHLADYSVKEAQIFNEKHVLEKRIAYMRLAFDQQQQDLADAASKALTYRQDIIEENINLTYALQAAQQERSTYMSCLLPLLLEYGFQPSVTDAQSIINSMKVLFKHLQEKLSITEAKLNACHHHIAPWYPDLLDDNSGYMMQSPVHSYGTTLVISNPSNLEVVPRQTYSHAQTPILSPLNSQPISATDWDGLSQLSSHPFSNEGILKPLDEDNIGGTPPS